MKTVILALLVFSGCAALGPNTHLAPGLQDIKIDVAKGWQRNCENYFFWRTPKIIAYRAGSSHELLAPVEWCRRESKQILRDKLPYDYYSDIVRDS